MSNNVELTVDDYTIEEDGGITPTPVVPKPKIKKARKPMTPEHKAKLVESLKKAREQSALKRGLKSQAKKIIKEADEAETNEIIRKSLLVKAKAEHDPRDVEIKKLRAKLDGLTLQDVIKKPKPKPKVIIEEPEFEPIDEPDEPKPEPKAEPKAEIRKVQFEPKVDDFKEPIVEPKKIFKSTRGSKFKRR